MQIRAVSEDSSWFLTLLISLLPWVIIIGLIVYSSRKMRERMGGAGGIFGFAKSKAKRYKPAPTGKTFADVAGLENAKRELQEIVAYLKNPSKFKALGGELPKGLLLVGPPGVGKTLLAQAAGEADVPFISISGSEFMEMFVGVGASRVRDMFTQAKKAAPSIIFVDKLDSIGRVRGTGLGSGHDEREQTLNQILAEMDGFSPHESLVILAATNRPDVLDPALVRPGRFDRRIVLELPQKEARRKILQTHTRGIPLAGDVDLASMAERTVGLSGAELKNLVNEVALLAAREDKQQVDMQGFARSRNKILIGLEREDVITDRDHRPGEEGHRLSRGRACPDGRAPAGGRPPAEDFHHPARPFPGRHGAAPAGGPPPPPARLPAGPHCDHPRGPDGGEDRFRRRFHGPVDELKKATRLARRMVSHWGMSEAIGPVAFRDGEPHPFLCKELREQRDYSEHTARLIDEEVQRIVREMEERALNALGRNRPQLDALARNLLEHETLAKEDVDRILCEAGRSESDAA